MRYTLMSGAGNRFAVVDGFTASLPDDPSALAREICAPPEQGGLEPRPDGLLLVRRPRAGGDCAMELYNADGSRPETCGNGLRCVAKMVHDRGHVAKPRFVIETDAGPRASEVVLEGGSVVRARVHMGSPRILARGVELVVAGNLYSATLVDVGNPHCVLLVDDERTAPVLTVGPLLERHPRFPEGTNVEFLALREEGIFLRVWERGVGETQACGSGACAAAVAAQAAGRARWPVRIELQGGRLDIESDGQGGVYLTGPVEELGSGDWTRGAQAAQARDTSAQRRG